MRPLHTPGPLVLGLLVARMVLPCGLPAQQAAGADTLAERFFAVVRARSPDLAVGRAEVAAAEARLLAAGPREAPVLSAELEDIPDGVDVPTRVSSG